MRLFRLLLEDFLYHNEPFIGIVIVEVLTFKTRPEIRILQNGVVNLREIVVENIVVFGQFHALQRFKFLLYAGFRQLFLILFEDIETLDIGILLFLVRRGGGRNFGIIPVSTDSIKEILYPMCAHFHAL